MFGAKNKVEDSAIPVLTIDHFPGKEFEVIGMVTSDIIDPKLFKGADISKIIPSLSATGKGLGADAIIGTRVGNAGAGMIYGYGTAIKFK